MMISAEINGSIENGKKDIMAAKQADCLNKFDRIGPEIWFYNPTSLKPTDTESHQSSNPDLIIMCSWLNASPRYIFKYAEHYLDTTPSSAILILRCAQVDIMFKSERQQLNALSPAVSAINTILQSLPTPPKVLMHIFSNGGGWTAGLLCDAYKHSAPHSTNLPITATVLDSCPSIPRMRILHRELSLGLPKNVAVRVIGAVLLWILILLIRVLSKSGFSSNVITRVRKHLNDATGAFVGGGAPRVYICSDKDDFVPLGDVKKHAKEARDVMRWSGLEGEEAERRIVVEQFEGSAHVGHIRVDQERYWRIVERVWKDGVEIAKKSS